MYFEEIRHNPAPGKAQELRAALEEWVRTAPSRGSAHYLGAAILDPEGPVLINGIRHEDLAAFGAYREQARTRQAPPYPQSLLDRPPQRTLWEVLVPLAPGTGNPARYGWRVTNYPAAGKAGAVRAVRALLEERVKSRQAGGAQVVLTAQVFGQEGTVFATTTLYQDLASLETFMHSNPQTPEMRAFLEKLVPLQARPAKNDLFQVLVPLPRG